MPLSEYERQTLHEMELELADPARRPGPTRGRAVLRGTGALVGLLLIIAGLRIAGGSGVFVAVVGYGLTVAVTASTVAAARRRWWRGRLTDPDRPE